MQKLKLMECHTQVRLRRQRTRREERHTLDVLAKDEAVPRQSARKKDPDGENPLTANLQTPTSRCKAVVINLTIAGIAFIIFIYISIMIHRITPSQLLSAAISSSKHHHLRNHPQRRGSSPTVLVTLPSSKSQDNSGYLPSSKQVTCQWASQPGRSACSQTSRVPIRTTTSKNFAHCVCCSLQQSRGSLNGRQEEAIAALQAYPKDTWMPLLTKRQSLRSSRRDIGKLLYLGSTYVYEDYSFRRNQNWLSMTMLSKWTVKHR